MFIPLFKVEAADRLVYGRIDETPDRSGEIFDYESCKPEFQAWSQDVAAATGGKSLGNVRAMHGKVAAGKLEKIAFDDAARRIDLVAHIVDDDEWAKVEAGVYTGFSPGGHYLKRWPDGDYTRYTARPVEISIVDLPCIPSATFTLVKADGATVERPFRAAPGDGTAGLAKALDAARADLARLGAETESLRRRVAELESLARPGGPVLRAVAKADDVGGAEPDRVRRIDALPDGPEKSLALIKEAHRHPRLMRL